jgi:hypothetical protein
MKLPRSSPNCSSCAILYIRLAPGNILDMTSVDQKYLKMLFQDVKDRLPEHTRRLHSDVANPFRGQPVAQGKQVPGHRPEGAHLHMNLAPIIHTAHADSHCLTVNVKSSAATKNRIHYLRHGCLLQFGLKWRSPRNEAICFSCSTRLRRQQSWVRNGDQIRLVSELTASQSNRP